MTQNVATVPHGTLYISQDGQDFGQGFGQEVENVLRRFHDPEWLGTHSPLASTYFLGTYLQNQQNIDSDDAIAKGQLLQQILREATAAISEHNEKSGEQRQRLIEMRYLNPYPYSAKQTEMELNISSATYARHRKSAVSELSQELIKRLKPALRLESPMQPDSVLGRTAELDACLAVLSQRKTVSLSGQGGIGKTTLAGAVAERFAPAATFWFTIQPGLNDRPSSLLFNLAYFLQGHGASSLWSEIMADRGIMNELFVAFNLLRSDLTVLRDKSILLCFDEIDLLAPTEVEIHTQLVSLFESLRPLAPIIFIGQKHLIEADHYCLLTGLPLSIIREQMRDANVELSPKHLKDLQTHTQGNPRLLELFMTLHKTMDRSNEPFTETLSDLLDSCILSRCRI